MDAGFDSNTDEVVDREPDYDGQSKLKTLKEIVKRGETEDRILSPWWIAVILFLDFLTTVAFLAYDWAKLESGFEGYFISRKVGYGLESYRSYGFYVNHAHLYYVLAGIASAALLIVMIYVYINLISRRNKHFKRTAELYNALADYLESMGGDYREISWRIREIAKRCEIDTGTRNVAGWVVLSVLPVINAFAKPYIFHFLTRDYYRHERYEELILKCLSSKFPKLQLVNFEYPDRDTVMYFLLSAITVGIFWIYWMYTLFSDPNRHFKEHRVFEELLLEELS